MKPPGPYTWLIGNSVVSLVLMLGGAAMVGLWLMGMADGLLAFAAAMVAGLAARASERVRAHASWEREWNGHTNARRSSIRWPGGRMVLGLAAWGWLAWLALQSGDGPLMQAVSLLFWPASVVMLVAAMLGRGREKRRRSGKAQAVGVCLAVPLRSPSLRDAYAALD